MILETSSGQQITLAWLRDSSVEQIEVELGRVGPTEVGIPVRDGSTIKTIERVWVVAGVLLHRTDAISPSPFSTPMVSMTAQHVYPFTLDAAFTLAGIEHDTIPPPDKQTQDGDLTWYEWPGLGVVRLDYPDHGIATFRYRDPEPGHRKPVPDIIDLMSWKRAA